MSQSAAMSHRLLPNEIDARAKGTLTNASAALLTCPAGQTYRIYSIIMTETTGVAKTYTLRLVATGGTDDARSDLFQAIPLTALEVQQLESAGVKPLVIMTGGDVLKGLASANTAVNYLINYTTEK